MAYVIGLYPTLTIPNAKISLYLNFSSLQKNVKITVSVRVCTCFCSWRISFRGQRFDDLKADWTSHFLEMVHGSNVSMMNEYMNRLVRPLLSFDRLKNQTRAKLYLKMVEPPKTLRAAHGSTQIQYFSIHILYNLILYYVYPTRM